jgi:predicted Zn-dependent protease
LQRVFQMMRPFIPILLALTLLSGCAGTPKPTAAAPTQDAPTLAKLIAKGKDAARQGDAVRAEQYLALAIHQGANKVEVMPVLLRSCLKSSHLRAALNHAQPYLLEHPEDDSLRYLVATIHLGLGQRTAARRELAMLLDHNPDDPDGHYLLGVLDTEFDPRSAKAHFDAAVEHTKNEEQRIEIQSRLVELRHAKRELAETAP